MTRTLFSSIWLGLQRFDSRTQIATPGLWRLTFELSGWPRQDAWAARGIVLAGPLAAQAACRGQSALERGVRPHPADCSNPTS